MGSFMDSEFGKMFNHYFSKIGDYPKLSGWQFILNRYCSFCKDKDIIELSQKMDRYIFRFYDKEWLLKMMFDKGIKKQAVPWYVFKSYIKKPKEEEGQLDFLFNDLQKYYHWTDRELELNKIMLIEIFKNKDTLKKAMNFVGSDIKQYKAMGVKLEEPNTKMNNFARFM